MKSIRDIIKLCLITKIPTTHTELKFQHYLSFVKETVRAGVTMVQHQENDEDKDTLIFHATLFKKMLHKYDVPLIINNHIDIAKAIDADGVHLEQNGLSPIIARQVLGKYKTIGLSVESVEQVLVSNTYDIDYISVSSIFKPNNKLDTPVPDLEILKIISRLSIHPTIAMGEINEDNANKVIHAGAQGIAVIGAIHNSDDPYYASEHLLDIVNANLHPIS